MKKTLKVFLLASLLGGISYVVQASTSCANCDPDAGGICVENTDQGGVKCQAFTTGGGLPCSQTVSPGSPAPCEG